ncbi:MAG TPA: M14 family zinc carboxypeptidase [Kofleriaceae bacterium]|nr:M14 family zinc carboxypeptidase [Kofleriaceae bacterium]
MAIRVEPSPIVDSLALDVWQEGDPTDVVVRDDALAELTAAGIAWQMLVPDIDEAARDESARIRTSQAADWFDEFHDYGAITEHLQELRAMAPDRVSMQSIGASVEGRPLWALRIGHGHTRMLVNGTEHAREWLAAMVSTCVADRLVRDYDHDAKVKAFVDRTEVWVVPVVNPDGYQYSWSNDRYWRKNRRDRHGVDLNRNFAVGFGGAGSSNNESSQTYRGPHAFSEPETAALRDLASREDFALHLDFHTYGQLLLYPWSYTHASADDHRQFAAIGDRIATAMFVQHQTQYQLQQAARLYLASGSMMDWMYGDRAALSYVIELRPKGGSGFVVPPSEIRPTCDEGLAAVLELRNGQE